MKIDIGDIALETLLRRHYLKGIGDIILNYHLWLSFIVYKSLFRRHSFEIIRILVIFVPNLRKQQPKKGEKKYLWWYICLDSFLTFDEFLTSWVIWDSCSWVTSIYTHFSPSPFQENLGIQENPGGHSSDYCYFTQN